MKKCVLCFLVEFISFFFLGGWGIEIFHFTKSRLRLHPLQTPDPLLRCPMEQSPRWADGRFSVFCTRRQSCPTGLCVSVGEQQTKVVSVEKNPLVKNKLKKWFGCNLLHLLNVWGYFLYRMSCFKDVTVLIAAS